MAGYHGLTFEADNSREARELRAWKEVERILDEIVDGRVMMRRTKIAERLRAVISIARRFQTTEAI